MSWLGILNRFLLQWFFIRLTRCSENVIENFDVHSYDMMADGNISSRGTGKIKYYHWYSIQFWAFPLSGWSQPYKFIGGKSKFIQITKKKTK